MKTVAWVLVVSLGFAAVAVGQEGSEGLARARVLEEQEGDLAAAEEAYRALLEGEGAAEVVKARAALRLGTLLWRLERREEARPWLLRAVEAGGEVGVAARGVLDGDGSAVEQDAALAARVRDALARLVGGGLTEGDPAKDLRWLGESAVPTIVRVLEERRDAAVEAIEFAQRGHGPGSGPRFHGPWWFFLDVLGSQYGSGDDWFDALSTAHRAFLIAERVWELGGPDAERFLSAAAADPDVRWRRLIAKASTSSRPCDATLGIVEQLFDDDDPEGIVPFLVLHHAARLPIPVILGPLESSIDRVRLAAWASLRSAIRWSESGGVRDSAFAVVEPALQRALSGPDPATARSAFEFLCSYGARTSAGMIVLLEWLPRVQTFQQAVWGDGPWDPLLLRHVVRAARVLGPVGVPGAGSSRQRYVSNLANQIAQAKPEGAVGPLLDLIELGYDAGFAPTAVEAATEPEELVRAASLLDRCAPPWGAARALADRDLPAAAFEPLFARFVSWLERAAVGASLTQHEWWRECSFLLQAIARTKSAAAPSAFSRLVAARPDAADTLVVEGMLVLASQNDDEAVSAMLREVLTSSVIESATRNLVFAELVRRGDGQAATEFPKAYERGLTSSRPGWWGSAQRGAQWLLNGREPSAAFRGFDDDDSRDVWSALLSSPSRDEVLEDLAVWPWLSPQTMPPSVAELLAPVLGGQLPGILGTLDGEVDGEPGSSNRAQSWIRLATAVAAWTPAGDGPVDVACREAIATLLREDAFDLDLWVAESVPVAAIPWFASEFGAVMRRHASYLLAQRMRAAGVGLDVSVVIAMLTHEDESRRLSALGVMGPLVDPTVLRRVEELVTDPSGKVRASACMALGRNLSADSVAVLLNALQDRNFNVRDAATTALERIRLYHEQKAFWNQFEHGITTSREAAAAKLLAQARPGEPHDQRLLALRSLGVLGAPEALPYLIEWTQDGDAEVATAAREAVAEVHRRAGAEKR